MLALEVARLQHLQCSRLGANLSFDLGPSFMGTLWQENGRFFSDLRENLGLKVKRSVVEKANLGCCSSHDSTAVEEGNNGVKSRFGVRWKWIFRLMEVEISTHIPLVVTSSVVFGGECKGGRGRISPGFFVGRRGVCKPMPAGN
ncbi:Hypothetical predicted protein [Olea europaea subsp. europaea]|uniref:Uncharacterized protein n=1 Tax=Olea europaea subsp. europaea TaxID=158383 RepID=A0A8S0U4L0_OLEEU|nr:Hypothetical predicted protein [Olea europaea subsp. europaea]